ncbi:MAG TPA: chemotaxis protein CheW [bacterium]|nr:chemotaxis protein CheW [bacterium]
MAEIKAMRDHRAEGTRLRQLVTFTLGSEEYGVDIMRVQEIIRFQDVTRVPQMPAFIEGVINLRGNVIPVLDLRKRFELGNTEHTAQTRIVVINVGSKTMGIVVDAVSEVMRLAEEQIEPPPSVVAGIGHEYLQGVGKVQGRLLILLDLDRILNAGEQAALPA